MQTSPKRHRLHTKTRHNKPCIACLQESTRRAHGQPHRHRHSSDTSPPPKPPKGIFFVSFVTEGHFEIKQRKKNHKEPKSSGSSRLSGMMNAPWAPREQRPLQGRPLCPALLKKPKPSRARGQGPVGTLEPFWPGHPTLGPSTDRQMDTHTHRKTQRQQLGSSPYFPM